MKWLSLCVLAGLVANSVADPVFSYPHNGTGTLNMSSWVWEEGTDADFYSYESFVLPTATDIAAVSWRGGYQYTGYGSVFTFNITIYESTAGDTQPYCNNPQLQEWYLADFDTGGIANQTPAGVFGGVQMYDYYYELPVRFHALAGKKYWIRIEGLIAGSYPGWGIASGSGGNGSHFTFSTGAAMFRFYPNDTCFTLYDAYETLGPEQYVVTEGEEITGDLGSLYSADDNRLLLVNDASNLSATLDVTSAATSVLSPRDLRVTVEQSAERGGLSLQASLKNRSSGNFDFISGITCPTHDTVLTLNTLNANYVLADGTVQVRLRWLPINDEDPAQDGWGHLVDLVSFRVGP